MPCVLALCLHAAGVPVLRFVPVAGTESDVPMSSLQKVVFTQDSIVLVSDANTQIKLYHSMNDDVVAKENTLEMYQLFQQSGVTQAELDTTTLYGRHYEAGIVFTAQLMVDMSGW